MFDMPLGVPSENKFMDEDLEMNSAWDDSKAKPTPANDVASAHDPPTFTECIDRLPPEDSPIDEPTWHGQCRTAIMSTANRIPIEMKGAVRPQLNWLRLDLFAEFSGGDYLNRPARLGGVGVVVG